MSNVKAAPAPKRVTRSKTSPAVNEPTRSMTSSAVNGPAPKGNDVTSYDTSSGPGAPPATGGLLAHACASLKENEAQARQLIAQLQGALEEDDEEAYEELQQELTKHHRKIDSFKMQITMLNNMILAVVPHDAPGSAISSDSSQSFQTQFKVPSDLPRYGKGDKDIRDATKFLRRFEISLRTCGLDPSAHWERLLPSCMVIDTELDYVARTLLGAQLSWVEAKDVFQKHFGSPHLRLEKLFEWNNLDGPTDRESLQEYFDRVASIMDEAGVEGHLQQNALHLLQTLPREIRMHLATAAAFSPGALGSVQQVMDVALNVNSTASGKSKPTGTKVCDIHGKGAHSTSECRVKNNTKTRPNRTMIKQCSIHGQCGHSTTECRMQQSQDTTRSRSGDTVKSAVTCHKCKEQGHYANVCPSTSVNGTPIPHNRSSQQLRMASVNEASLPTMPQETTADDLLTAENAWMEYGESLVNNQRMRNMHLQEDSLEISNAREVIVAATVNGTRVKALLDIGATNTFVSSDFAKQYNLEVAAAKGTISLGRQGATFDRTGYIQASLSVGTQTIPQAKLEIFDLPHNGPPLCIGMDYFQALGFSIGGLPIGYPDECPLPATEASSAPRAPDRGADTPTNMFDPTSQETSSAHDELRARLMVHIQPALEANQMLPVSQLCPLPEAMVHVSTPPGKIFYRRQYPLPQSLLPLVQEAVDQWHKDGVITPAPPGTPHNNPLTLAPKKDSTGQWTLKRPCLDPRHLNQAMINDDRYPIPLIEDLFRKLEGRQFFTALDLRNAFHRLPVATGDQPKLAFTAPDGKHWMFVAAPFGLKTLTSTFQRVMALVFEGMTEHVSFFVDDVLISDMDPEAHITHVREAIERLSRANLILSPAKCHFAQSRIKLLGFIIDAQGKHVDPVKVANVADWPRPTTGAHIMHYLGIANFLRAHIPLIARLTHPLENLRCAKPITRELWTDACHAAWTNLKYALQHALSLNHVDWTQPLCVATDASSSGLGAVLYQEIDGHRRYILFQARSLQDRERRYSATKRELLAIVFALQRFHHYVWGRPFDLFTDHIALTHMFSQKDANTTILGWFDILLAYDFHIHHRPGIQNILPDHLSRLFTDCQDAQSHAVDAALATRQHLRFLNRLTDLVEITDLATRQQMLATQHALGHFGGQAMVDGIHSLGHTWDTLRLDCDRIFRECPDCQRYHIGRKGYHPLQPIHASLPFDHVCVDLAGPFPTSTTGHNFALILVDVATRFVVLRPLSSKLATEVSDTLFRIFCDFGFPRILQSDNGAEFLNQILAALCRHAGIDKRLITAYHPRANGLAEVSVRTTKQVLQRSFRGNHRQWDLFLPSTQLTMNLKVRSIHRSQPFSLMFGRRFNGFQASQDGVYTPLSPHQLRQRVAYLNDLVFPGIDHLSTQQQHVMKDQFDTKHSVAPVRFPAGSYVMAFDPRSNQALAAKYEGPFKVMRRTKGGAYTLQDRTGSILPRDYAPSQLKLIAQAPLNNGPSYEVESIIDHHGQGADTRYLVKWRGFDASYNSWEPYDSFDDVACVQRYWAQRPPVPSSNTLPSSGRG
jgi:transposase InsO family protein